MHVRYSGGQLYFMKGCVVGAQHVTRGSIRPANPECLFAADVCFSCKAKQSSKLHLSTVVFHVEAKQDASLELAKLTRVYF
jgi:hypothetical protein